MNDCYQSLIGVRCGVVGAQGGVPPVRVLRGRRRGGRLPGAAGGRGVVLAAAARRAARLRGRAVPHRQHGPLLPDQLEGMCPLPNA